MPNKLQFKRSNVAGKIPTPTDLDVGEIALNFPDQKLYTKDVSGNIIVLAEYNGQAIVSNPAAGVSQVITAADPADTPLTLKGKTGGWVQKWGTDSNVFAYMSDGYFQISASPNHVGRSPTQGDGFYATIDGVAEVSRKSAANLRFNQSVIGLHIYNLAAATIGLIIDSATGQTADLVRVDVNKLRIKANGDVEVKQLAGTGTRMVTADATGQLGDAPDPTGLIAVRKHDATATYAANALVQHQDGIWRAKAPVVAEAWDAAHWTRIDTDGAVTANSDGTITVSGSLTNVKAALNQLIAKQLYIEKDPVASQSIVNGGAVADVPLTIQGKAGQTGNLQQWSDSTGDITAEISSSGFNLQSSTFMPEAHITMESASSGGWGQPFLLAKRARGTMAAKEAVKNNEALFQLRTMGYKGDAYSGECGRISIYAGEDFTPTSCETYFELQLTKSGKTSIDEHNALIYTSRGQLGIGRGFASIKRPTHSLDVGGDASIQSNSATKPVLKILGATGQTADLLQVDTGKLVVKADGKVGIGANPTAPFEVSTNNSGQGIILRQTVTDHNTFIRLLNVDGVSANLNIGRKGLTEKANTLNIENTHDINLYPGGASRAALAVKSDGKVGIGTTRPDAAVMLDVNGKIKSTAALVVSDLRLKDNLEPVQDAGNKLKQITGYEYDIKGKRSAGLVAQEVEQILPQAVTTGDDGMKSLDYNQTIAVLVEAVKSLTARIEQLEAK